MWLHHADDCHHVNFLKKWRKAKRSSEIPKETRMKYNMWFTSWVDGKCSTFKGSSLEAPKAGKRILLSFEIILNPPTKNITIFRSIILFYGIDNVPQIIPYISHITLLQIWIMLWLLPWPLLLVRLQQMIWRKYTFVLYRTIYPPCYNARLYNTSLIQMYFPLAKLYSVNFPPHFDYNTQNTRFLRFKLSYNKGNVCA